MSLIINGMSLPKHSAVNGEKDTAYRCVVLAHPDNTVELVIDTEFASPYDNGHNIQRYPLSELPTPHGRLIDADRLFSIVEQMEGLGTLDSENDVALSAVEVLSIIDQSPTVIETEVGE